jgi:hypothetical protein
MSWRTPAGVTEDSPLPDESVAARQGRSEGDRQKSARRPLSSRLLVGPASVVFFVTTLVGAWVFSNPVGYTPDEDAHYIKAIGVGRGQWVGRPGQYGIGPGFGPVQLEWINRVARIVRVPAGIAPDNDGCALFRPEMSNACDYARPGSPPYPTERITYVGTYEPFLYVPAGLATRLARSATSGIRLGRAGSAAVALMLLGLGLLLAWRPGRPSSLVGFLVAVTPTAFFLASGLAPTGIEISAVLCFLAGGFRLRRGGQPGWVWAATTAAGGILAMTRSDGPYLLAAALAVIVLSSPRQTWVALRSRAALWSGLVLAACLGASVAWNLFVQPHPDLGVGDVLDWAGTAVRRWPRVYREAVAAFGWHDVEVSAAVHWAWGALLLSVIGLALAIGTWWQRFCLVLFAGGILLGLLVIAAIAHVGGDFPMYGRYALPLAVMLPVYAGEVISDRRPAPPYIDRFLPLCVAAVVAACHGVGWYANSRRYAVGARGPIFFLGRSEWEPSLGWGPWFAVVALSLAALVAWGIRSAREAS